jgi:hypothetical protein
VQNDTPPTVNPLWSTNLATESQWNNGGNNGDPSIAISVNDNWAYELTDSTNLYYHPDFYTAANGARGVTGVSRSLVWLYPDHVFVYDRGTTKSPSRFKRFNLVLMNPPTISGNTARSVAGGQALTVQSLMPAAATLYEQHFWTNCAVAGVSDAEHPRDRQRPADHRGQERAARRALSDCAAEQRR